MIAVLGRSNLVAAAGYKESILARRSSQLRIDLLILRCIPGLPDAVNKFEQVNIDVTQTLLAIGAGCVDVTVGVDEDGNRPFFTRPIFIPNGRSRLIGSPLAFGNNVSEIVARRTGTDWDRAAVDIEDDFTDRFGMGRRDFDQNRVVRQNVNCVLIGREFLRDMA